MKRLLITLVALLAIGGLAVGLSLLTPLRKPTAAMVDLPRVTRVTCLQSGDLLAYAPGNVVVRTESGEDSFTGGALLAEIAGPATLVADSLAVAGIHVAGPERTFAPCAAPSTSGTILVTEPGDAELMITNSDANEAVVDLTLLGPGGEVFAVGARGIAVAPGVTRRIALSVLAPEGPVGVVYSASQGRVAMAAVNVEGRAARYIGTTRPANAHLIAGVPAGAPSAQLVITNPFEERATITVSALGATSSYELAATADLSVEPMSSVAVELADSLGGEASTIRVQATQEVAAAVVVSGAAGSPTTLVGSEPATDLGATTFGGALQLTNPGSAQVTVYPSTGEPVTLEPGTTVVRELPVAAQELITLEASGPVLASAVVAEATGTLIVPLGRIAEDPQEPGLTRLDPHLR